MNVLRLVVAVCGAVNAAIETAPKVVDVVKKVF